CVTGSANTGKSSTIRAFTKKYLKYSKANGSGDILGIFSMPYIGFPVGVSGSGDDVPGVQWGLNFLSRCRGIKVMIVASHKRTSATFKEVETFARRKKATLHRVPTKKLVGNRARSAAIRVNVAEIRRLMR